MKGVVLRQDEEGRQEWLAPAFDRLGRAKDSEPVSAAPDRARLPFFSIRRRRRGGAPARSEAPRWAASRSLFGKNSRRDGSLPTLDEGPGRRGKEAQAVAGGRPLSAARALSGVIVLALLLLGVAGGCREHEPAGCRCGKTYIAADKACNECPCECPRCEGTCK